MLEIDENSVVKEKPIRGEPPLIYYYNPFTKEFLKEGYPDPDQTNTDNWLYPAFATLITVIDPKDGYARIFDENKQVWDYIEDHRNEIWYDKTHGEEVIINCLGKIDETFLQKDKPTLPECKPIMPELTRFQMKVVIHKIGKSEEDILNLINKISDENQKILAKLAWEEALTFNYDSPIIKTLLPNLGLSEKEIETKWLEASKVKV